MTSSSIIDNFVIVGMGRRGAIMQGRSHIERRRYGSNPDIVQLGQRAPSATVRIPFYPQRAQDTGQKDSRL